MAAVDDTIRMRLLETPEAQACRPSVLVDAFFNSVFGIADFLLDFTFDFLRFAFSAQLVIASGFAYALLDVTDCFVSGAFDFIASAAHRCFSSVKIRCHNLDIKIDPIPFSRVSNIYRAFFSQLQDSSSRG